MITYDAYLRGDACTVCYDVTHLLDAGELGDVIATRMGRNRESLQKHLRNHDRALLTRFNLAAYADTAMRRPA